MPGLIDIHGEKYNHEEPCPDLYCCKCECQTCKRAWWAWKATPAKGVQIELTLRDDKTFTWKFTANGKTQNFAGKYKCGRQVAGADPRGRRTRWTARWIATERPRSNSG